MEQRKIEKLIIVKTPSINMTLELAVLEDRQFRRNNIIFYFNRIAVNVRCLQRSFVFHMAFHKMFERYLLIIRHFWQIFICYRLKGEPPS